MTIHEVAAGIAENVTKELELADDNWDALSDQILTDQILTGLMVDPTFRKLLSF